MFGSLIVVAGFVVDPTGVVHSSVLYVFAICIVNAAALEGIDLIKVMDFFKTPHPPKGGEKQKNDEVYDGVIEKETD